jgi:bifunctional non-homologous end joining protein LigD
MPTSPYAPCIPTRWTAVPSHSDWIHEVKQDGFRLIQQRDGERVRLLTRNGYDWTSRYPLIVEAARRIRTSRFVLDGSRAHSGWDPSATRVSRGPYRQKSLNRSGADGLSVAASHIVELGN